MNTRSRLNWSLSIISLVVFLLTFFIFFRETHEVFSSMTAAFFCAVLILGTLIIGNLVIRVFKK